MTPSPRHPDPADFSLYVHIPFCQKKCRYCAFYSSADAHNLPQLLAALRRELESRVPAAPAETVYLGGGSPSLLTPRQTAALIEPIIDRCGAGREFTVEVNPAQASRELLQTLHRLGVNRLSIGAQSFQQHELDFLGRIHKTDEITAAVRRARQAGFDNLSLDLIFAIPGSTPATWHDTLTRTIRLEPQHVSAYSLTYEENTPLRRDLEAGLVEPVPEDLDVAMYETAIDTLEAAGYAQVEISNFARPGFACLHNVRGWHNRPYIGLGPSAASWHDGRRTGNIADIDAYLEQVEQTGSAVADTHAPTPDEIACETAVLNLRLREGIDRADYRRQIGRDPADLFAAAVETNRRAGLLEVTPDRIRLTRRALPIADTVLADFATPE